MDTKATVLDRSFDPVSLMARPGLYVASSGSIAYTQLSAMAVAGLAKRVGEHMLRDRRRVLTAQVGSIRTNPSVGQITIGRNFFVTALKDYADWAERWFREAIQNSVDAKSTEIDISVKANENGTWTARVTDNGGGMSEDVLLNKFLVLGETTKVADEGTAGGFGKAKELLVLPWISWKIHSKDTEVNGAGIDYSVSKASFLAGTSLEVVMPGDNHVGVPDAISFIEKSYLPRVHFTVNGKDYRAALKTKGDPIATVEGKAEIYFVKAKVEQSYMLVRARGLFMFDKYLGEGIPGYVIVEITAPSIQILTANRDGFRDYSTRREVDSFASRIAKDVTSATRSKKGMIRQKFEGIGKFRPQRAAEALVEVGPVHEPTTKAGADLSDAAVERVAEIVENFRLEDQNRVGEQVEEKVGVVSGDTARAMLGQMKMHGSTHVEAAVKQLVWQPDFYIINDIDGYRVQKKFFVGTMTPTVLKLAKIWTEMCRFVLIQLGSSASFGVGFIFSENTAAAFLREDGENWLLLNPHKKMTSQTDVWSVADVADLQWLYAAAIHECTHMANHVNYHDESFAAAFTLNVAKCANGFRRIKQIVSSIRMSGSPSLEGGEAEPKEPKEKKEPKPSDAALARWAVIGLEEEIGSLQEEMKDARTDSYRDLIKSQIEKKEDSLEKLIYGYWYGEYLSLDDAQRNKINAGYKKMKSATRSNPIHAVSIRTGESKRVDQDRKVLMMAIYKRLKQVGDGRIVNGKHVVMHAPSGYKTFVLEDMSYDALYTLGKKLAGR